VKDKPTQVSRTVIIDAMESANSYSDMALSPCCYTYIKDSRISIAVRLVPTQRTSAWMFGALT
jgi:hypothetical protein